MQGPTDAHSMWKQLERDFLSFHQKPLNVVLHLLTTPLGLLGTFSLLASLHPRLGMLGALAVTLSFFGRVPLRLALASGALLLGLAQLATLLTMDTMQALALIVAGYGLQELAHRVSGEQTFQSSYEQQQGAAQNFALHTWMLVPLVLAAGAAKLELVRELLPRIRVVDGHLDRSERRADIELVRAWVISQQPSDTHTTHWWFRDTPEQIQAALARLASAEELLELFRRAHPGRAVEIVHSMNEIYVAAANPQRSSDTVFYTPHIDGPFAIWPFATVYRSLLAVTENTRVQTRFIHPTVHAKPLAYTLTKGDFLAFDFNREPHFICDIPGREDRDQRCVLKIHYVVYPEGMPRYGRLLARLTGFYDLHARNLFLATLTPASVLAKFGTNLVLWTTNFFYFVVMNFGWGNLSYLALLGLVSALAGSFLPFLIGASFVHYLLYIAVFKFRDSISFGQFKRDALLFRTLAHAMLIGLYAYTYTYDPLSLGLIVGGYGLASAATYALGLDRTYFGVELGQCPPKQITRFPYNAIPHPMIVGTLIALLGYQLHAPLRELVPWLVPIHVAFYAIHLAQEIADTRARERAC